MIRVDVSGDEGMIITYSRVWINRVRLPILLLIVVTTFSFSVYMYVCIVITYSRVWINRVRLPILLVVS